METSITEVKNFSMLMALS